MHGGANVILFGLCVEIITVTIALHFLAKAKKEELGGGFKWAGRILVILGFLAIACTLSRGAMQMMHRGDGSCQQGQCCPMMHDGCMHDGGSCMHDGKCCDMHDGKCDMHDGMMKDGKECKMDSASGKKCHMCKDREMGKDGMHKDSAKSDKK